MKNVLLSLTTSSRLSSARAECKKGPFQVEIIEELLNIQSEHSDNDFFNVRFSHQCHCSHLFQEASLL